MADATSKERGARPVRHYSRMSDAQFSTHAQLFDLTGKRALVTGGTRGIGLMMARGLLQAGAQVVISSRKADACESARAEFSGLGDVEAIPADLSRHDECLRLAEQATAGGAPLHILVNNAGATWGEPLESFPDSAWDKVLDLNVKSPFWMVQALLPALREAGTADDPARVINVGSIDGIRPSRLPVYSYVSSKAALHQLDANARPRTRAAAHHRKCRCARAFPVQDDGSDARDRSVTRSRRRLRFAASVVTTTWPASRCSWPAARVPTSPAPSFPSTADSRRPRAADVADKEQRDGVDLTNLDEPLTPDAGATKRDLVDYLEAVADRMLPALIDRPLTVLRVLRGREPFMQKNVPKYTPDWVRTVPMWAEASHREVHYALCNDWRTLLWLANQRAVEYHPTLGLADNIYRPTHLVLDLDPPDDDFAKVVAVAHLVHQALTDSGLGGAVKTSGAKGLHVFVPIDDAAAVDDVAAATRALAARAEALDPDIATTAFIVDDRGGKVFVDATRAGGATVAAAYTPRLRPGTPVSFPLEWAELDSITPADFTVHTAIDALAGRPSWTESMPPAQTLPTDLIEHGRTIPVARVAAMHEGKRRAKARRASE